MKYFILLFSLMFLFSNAANSARPKSLSSLEKEIFNRKAPMKKRWKALVEVARMNTSQAESLISRAVSNPDWYVRAGALQALFKMESHLAPDVSVKLLRDPSLIVRISAVKTLRDLNKRNYAKHLWKVLKDPINFNRGYSLGVRRAASRVLAEWKSGSKEQWARFLKDSDVVVREIANSQWTKL